ncbi:MAG: DUF47 family protein [candidate division Zixibacteria bacterium]|nr:DUF47 family protein [candidate division Zixibacteria bacterium]
MPLLFKSTKILESQIDDFLDAISQGGLVFKEGVKSYLECEDETFERRIEAIKKLENKADDLRRQIENQLYTHSLIPEHRGDVLGLLENLDDVIDTIKKTLVNFSIEAPDIPVSINRDFLELTEMSVMATDKIVNAARAFFKDISAVKDHLHKVLFYEKEADRIEERLNRKVFRMDIELGLRLHTSRFAFNISRIADVAEGVADRLNIYTIKRTV